MRMGRIESAPMLIALRLTHIVFGVFWAGTAMFNAIFLIPAVRALGPAGAPVMQQIGEKQNLSAYFLGSGVLTVLSGLGLYWYDSKGFTGEFMRSRGGMTFGTGGVLAIAAIILGIFVITPAAKRAAALGGQIAAGGKPPTPEQGAEMKRLQMRIGKTGALGALLLTLTTIAMAVARYL